MAPQNGEGQRQLRDSIARCVYFGGMAIFVLWSILILEIACHVIWVCYFTSAEPEGWFAAVRTLLAGADRLLNPTNPDAWKLLTAIAAVFIGMVMSTLSIRCSGTAGKFERIVISVLLVVGTLQLVSIFLLPTAQAARDCLVHGDALVKTLSSILMDDTNAAFAVCGAALGLNFLGKVS